MHDFKLWHHCIRIKTQARLQSGFSTAIVGLDNFNNPTILFVNCYRASGENVDASVTLILPEIFPA